MKINKKFTLSMFVIIGIILMLSLATAVYTRSSPQYVFPGSSFSPSSGMYSTYFDRAMCDEVGQDFIVQIAPEGCQPYVVRSDLLAESEYPVACPMVLTKLNPLINVEAIKAMRITGQYPAEVLDVGFVPYRSALGYRPEEINSPILENIGYATILLKRQPKESELRNCEKDPIFGGEVCWVEGNLTARIRYDIENAFGVGRAEFYLPELNNADWEERQAQYGFWQGRAYVRADNIDNEKASISIYSRNNQKLHSVRLDKGETSDKLYIPELGYCLAGFKIRLNGLEDPDTRAKLKVNEDYVEIGDEEKFLDERCRVKEIRSEGLVQNVEIRCEEDEETNKFELSISPKISLRTQDQEDLVVSVGDLIYGKPSDEKRIFVGYLGENEKGKFIVLVESPAANAEAFKQTYIYNRLPEIMKQSRADSGNILLDGIVGAIGGVMGAVESTATAIATGGDIIGTVYEEGAEVSKLTRFMEEFEISISENYFTFKGLATPENADLTISGDPEKTELLREYYSKAVEDYELIPDAFPNATYPLNDTLTLNERSLSEKIILLEYLNQKAELPELCNLLKDKYKTSNAEDEKAIAALEICSNEYKLASPKSSSKEIVINGKKKIISFEGIYDPGHEEYGAILVINGKAIEVQKGVLYPFPDSDTDSFTLEKVTDNSVTIDYHIKETAFQNIKGIVSRGDTKTIKLDEQKAIVGKETYMVGVSQINLEKFASVSIFPDINYAETEADFQFKIGIEKRSIQLSPEKTKKRIDNLNQITDSLNTVSDGLGTTVEAMKTACLVTEGALTVKNAYLNSKGRGEARHIIMRGDNGWYERCVDMFNSGNYGYYSEEACLLNNSDKIENQVGNLTEVIIKRDEKIREIRNNNTFSQLFSTASNVNESAFIAEYILNVHELLDNLTARGIPQIPNPNYRLGSNDARYIVISEVQNNISFNAWKENVFELEDLKEIDLYTRLLNSTLEMSEEDLKNLSSSRLYKSLYNIKVNLGDFGPRAAWASDLNLNPDNILFIETEKNAKALPYSGVINNGYLPEWDDDTPLQHITTQKGERFTLVLEESAVDNKLHIRRVSYPSGYIEPYESKATIWVYNATGQPIEDKEKYPSELEKLYFIRYSPLTYQNLYKNPKVRFYETGPYAGNPAIVPFDLEKGWYAAVKSTVPALGNIRGYDESGRVHSFYLCNVGENNLEEFFSGIGDDDCKLFIPGEPNYPDDYFPGLSSTVVEDLIEDAIKAIKAAQVQNENQIITIKRGVEVERGRPAADLPEIKCQDFMSAKDCNILFNVCDPVMCPSSRCDLGGRYPVENVIQSGIVGGIALCLPNWNENIYVPVCVSGVKAGLDSLIDVGEKYQECLQVSLDSGETVGICDEVHSVYMCEFLWRQAAPLLQVAGSKVSERDTYGGGEYLNFLNLFDTAQQSSNFFTQYYAEDSFRAFKSRTTNDVGGAFCKSFRYLAFPGDMNLVEALIAPDSPFQFSGHFDETIMNTITNPPTSHYKVFYHIFAGEDESVYYRVYLKEGSESSFYNDPLGTKFVDAGYITAGDSIVETKDFIAPSGYQSLCINVNGIEECGFKQVSTSFATEYMEDYYLAQQGTETQIKTTKECVSGSLSAFNLLNPNIEAGLDELISPEIYNQGIIRICSTDKPGKATDRILEDEGRWQEVGYCDDPQIKCWLDRETLKDVIKASNLEEGALEELNEDQQKILSNESQLRQDFDDQILKIESEKNLVKRIETYTGLFDKAHFNSHKAYLFFKRGNTYAELAKQLYEPIKPVEVFPSLFGEPDEKDSEEESESEEALSQEEVAQALEESDIPYTREVEKLLALDKKDFTEYCSTASEQPGDAYCARYVTQAFDFWFGYGRSYLLGIRGNAWDIASTVDELGGKQIKPTIIDPIKYEELIPGDIIGIKRKADSSEYSKEEYTHVALYLGMFQRSNGMRPAVAHKFGQEIYIETIDAMLRRPGGEDFINKFNDLAPQWAKIEEEWKIVVVARPNQENLHISIEEYVRKNNLKEVRYIPENEMNVEDIAKEFLPGNINIGPREFVRWLIRENNNLETDLAPAGQELIFYVPSEDPPHQFFVADARIGDVIAVEPQMPDEITEGYSSAVSILKQLRRSEEEANQWASAIYTSLESNDFEDIADNYVLVLTVMEKESSISEAPTSRLKERCADTTWINPLQKVGCLIFADEMAAALSDEDKIIDEKEYLEMKDRFFGKLSFYRPLWSLGPMQVSVETASQLLRADEEKLIEEHNIPGLLVTKQGGTEFGIRYLRTLTDFYAEEYADFYETLEFIFADYNSGMGSSRNAAFQYQINKINQAAGNSDYYIAMDGKLGSSTAEAIEVIFGEETFEDLKLNSKSDLISGSSSKALEEKSFYRAVQIKYYDIFEEEPPYAIVPYLEYSGEGIKQQLSVQKYVYSSMCFMLGHCARTGTCSDDMLTVIFEGANEHYPPLHVNEDGQETDCRYVLDFIRMHPNDSKRLGFR